MRHSVEISSSGASLRDFESYEIALSMRQPSSTASLVGPLTPERLDRLPLGGEAAIHIDGRPVFSGLITSRRTSGSRLTVGLHDRSFLLVRNSAEAGRLPRDTIGSLAGRLVEGVYGGVRFSNAANRNLYGRGAQRVGSEPPVFDGASDPVRAPVGATRWTTLAEVLRRAELLAWSSADGGFLVIAAPNFRQEPRFEFVVGNGVRSTCASIEVAESVESAFSEVSVVGQSRVSPRRRTAYGENLERAAVASDDRVPIALRGLVIEEARSAADAQAQAQAYLEEANASLVSYSISAFRHGEGPALYAIDTVARVRDADAGLDELAYIAGVTYRGGRDEESTMIDAVPLGTKLVVP